MERKGDFLLGLGFFLFGIISYFLIIPKFVAKPHLSILDELPADLYPNFIMISISFLGIILIFQSLTNKYQLNRHKMVLENKKRAASTIGILLGFLFLINLLGYYIACTLFLVFCMFFLGERRILLSLLVICIFLLGNYLFFEKALNIHLPRGLLFS